MTDTEKIHRFAEQNLLIERYLLGELGGADLEDFEQHMFECSICFEEVKAAQAFKEGIAQHVSGAAPRKSLRQRIQDWWNRGKVQS